MITQGDWNVRSGFKVTCGEEQTWIADCYPFHENHPRPRMVEAEANAHMIAAAPEMYEALKTVKQWLDNFGMHSPIIFGGEQEISDTINKALAKANGKI